MVLKLYFDFLSQPSRALFILLKHSNLSFESCKVALLEGEHFSEEYKDIHKFGKVPAVHDDGFKLIESIAILRYLAREKNLPDFWYPKDSKQQARVDEYLEWQHNNTRAFCASYFMLKFVQPMLTGKPPLPAKVAKIEKRMSDSLDILENVWLKNSNFFANNEFSAADLWGACEVEQTRIVGYDPTNGRPLVKAWLERVRNITNPYYDEAHKIIQELAEGKGQLASNL